jgi:hypothetical protein
MRTLVAIALVLASTLAGLAQVSLKARRRTRNFSGRDTACHTPAVHTPRPTTVAMSAEEESRTSAAVALDRFHLTVLVNGCTWAAVHGEPLSYFTKTVRGLNRPLARFLLEGLTSPRAGLGGSAR